MEKEIKEVRVNLPKGKEGYNTFEENSIRVLEQVFDLENLERIDCDYEGAEFITELGVVRFSNRQIKNRLVNIMHQVEFGIDNFGNEGVIRVDSDYGSCTFSPGDNYGSAFYYLVAFRIFDSYEPIYTAKEEAESLGVTEKVLERFQVSPWGLMARGNRHMDRDKGVSLHRQGQTACLVTEFRVRTSSNILCKCQDFIEPLSWKDIQKHLKLKDRAFNNFKKDMVKLNRLKEVNGTIYVNPTYMISLDMDYIREELMEMFPEGKEEMIDYNKYLEGGEWRL